MAVGVPAVSRDQAFPQRAARLGHGIPINDPGILQQHRRGADAPARHEIAQTKQRVRAFFAADSGHLIVQQPLAVQQAGLLRANAGADVTPGNGLVGREVRHDEGELVLDVAGEARHQIERQLFATRHRQSRGFDDELQIPTPKS